MGLSFVQKNEGIHPAHASIKYSVESDGMTEQIGSLGTATITFNTSTVQHLDYFTVLGVKITFKTLAEYMNDIEISNAIQHAARFESILITNSVLSTQLNYSKNQVGSDVVFQLAMKNGGEDITVKNVIGSGVNVVNNNSFVALTSKSNYILNINIFGNGYFIDNIYSAFLAELNADRTTIQNAKTEFELPVSVSNQLLTLLPSFNAKSQLMPDFHKVIKLVLNDNWNDDGQSQDGYLLQDETLTVINAKAISETDWSIFDDGDNERQSFYINTPSDYCTPKSAFRFVILYAKAGKNVIVSFKNDSGSVLQSFTIPITADGFHQIAVGVPSYENELTVNVSDIKSVSVLYEKVAGGLPSVSNASISIDYCNCPSENFIFLSKYGTYEPMTLQPIKTVKDKINRDSVQFAEKDTRAVITSSIQKTYRANFFELEDYSMDQQQASDFMLDFANSTEIYWIVDNNYIKVEPATATIDSYSTVKRISEKFEFRTAIEYALKQ